MDEASQGVIMDLAGRAGRPAGACCASPGAPGTAGLRVGARRPRPHSRAERPDHGRSGRGAGGGASDEPPCCPMRCGCWPSGRWVTRCSSRSCGGPTVTGAPLDALPDSVDSAVTAQIDHLSTPGPPGPALRRRARRPPSPVRSSSTCSSPRSTDGSLLRSRPRGPDGPTGPGRVPQHRALRPHPVPFGDRPGLRLRGTPVPAAPGAATGGRLATLLARTGGREARPSSCRSTSSTPSATTRPGATRWWQAHRAGQKYANARGGGPLPAGPGRGRPRLPEVEPAGWPRPGSGWGSP